MGNYNDASIIAFLTERASVDTSVAALGQLWLKNTNPTELWFTDDAGSSFQVNTGARAYGGISAESNAVATTIGSSSSDFSNAVQIVTFGIDNSISANVTPDHTQDHLTIDLAGNYQVNLSMSLTGTAADVISFAVFKNNKAVQMGSRVTHTLTGNVDSLNLSLPPMPFVPTDTAEVWIQNETAGRNATMQDASFSVHRFD